MPDLPREAAYFVEKLRGLQLAIRDSVLESRRGASAAAMRSPEVTAECDVIYSLDTWADQAVLTYCSEWAEEMPFVLVSEGSETGRELLPVGVAEDDCEFVVILDPVDGTRGLMYDKRSAWVLSGVAPWKGGAARLSDIVVAMQTEIPTTKQYLATLAYAVEGQGARAEQHNVLTGEVLPLELQPSDSPTIVNGFATVAKFFPGGMGLAAAIEERLMEAISDETGEEFPMIFDDEYIASGGQLHELMVGHDLFVADLRPLLLAHSGVGSRLAQLCAHPYDLCAELIAREAGVIVTDLDGHRLSDPLDTTGNVLWMGFANRAIQEQVFPALQEIVRELGLV